MTVQAAPRSARSRIEGARPPWIAATVEASLAEDASRIPLSCEFILRSHGTEVDGGLDLDCDADPEYLQWPEAKDIFVPQERPFTPAFFSPSWPVETAANGIVTYVAAITEALRSLGLRPCVLAGVLDSEPPDADVYPVDGAKRSLAARLRDPLAFRINPIAALRGRCSDNVARATRPAISERDVELLEIEEDLRVRATVEARPSDSCCGSPSRAVFRQRGGSAATGSKRIRAKAGA